MKAEEKDRYSTVFVIMAGFLIVYLLTWLKWTLWLAALVGVAGLLSPFCRRHIHKVWMKLGGLMGAVVSPILLTLVFCLVLLPLAILSRIFGRHDTLMLSNKHQSTFVYFKKQFAKHDFEKPW